DINKRLIDMGIEVLRLDLRVMDGAKLSFKDKTYDLVGYMNTLFEYEPSICKKFVAEGLRVARKWVEFDTADRTDYCPAPSKKQIHEWLGEKIVVDVDLSQKRRLYIARLAN
ncbi:unnamed protein product, partial [marine sediment metagenome]